VFEATPKPNFDILAISIASVKRNLKEYHRSKIMKFDNATLIKMYLEYRVPCDRLVSNPRKLERFTKDYISRAKQPVEPADLAHKLLNLRRKGQAKGGLPRLKRNYNGRGNTSVN
jgi:hypothetical protein